MFIRVKKIKGQPYAYLVHNTWAPGGSRQKVASYLGKVHSAEKKTNTKLHEFAGAADLETYFAGKEMKQIMADLVSLELHNHGAKERFSVDGHSVKLNGKDAVLNLNSGFMCSHTLKKLHEYKSEGDDGYLLASLLTQAGINAGQDVFVMLFEKLKSEGNSNSGEFYY